MKFISILGLFLLSSNVYAQDDTGLDKLLSEYTQKSDLSKKTKLSNTGHSIIFTRADIEKMQARNLKDIIKTLPMITYQENRFAVSNIKTFGEVVPFSSSSVRVYLDDHEMVSGVYGSGFGLFGNIELEFVDHIEIYYNTPSFEYSVESTFLLIKLHTKVPQRDKGGKVLLSNGSHGLNQQSAFYTDELNGISYFAYASNLDNKREKPVISGKDIQKSNDRKHFLGTLSDKNNHFLVDVQYLDINPLSNLSSDGSATKSLISSDNYQISYINKYFDDIKIKATYQKAYNTLHLTDDLPLYDFVYDFNTKYNDSVYNAEVDYAYKNSINGFFVGANARMKKVDVVYSKLNNIASPLSSDSYSRQNVYSIFAQDEIYLTDNSVLSLGMKHSSIDNDGGVSDHDFNLYRLGYVYNKDNFTGKVFYYHTPNLIEPYLYTSWFSLNSAIKPETSDVIYTQLEYKKDKNYLSLIYGQNKQKNTIYYNPIYIYNPLISNFQGSLDNADKIQRTNFINLDYKYNIDPLNSISTNAFINFIKDSPLNGNYKEFGGFVRFLNTIGKIDLYNEIIYRENDISNHAWFDYSAGIKYKYNNNLFLSLKGENLFNKALKEDIRAFDLTRTTVGTSSPVDKRIYASLEFMF